MWLGLSNWLHTGFNKNHKFSKFWHGSSQVDVKSFDFVKLCINICVVSEILLRVQRDMTPRAVIDSPKNLTDVEVEKLTANEFKRTESRFADLFLVVTFFFVASRLRALWIELTWFCMLIWKFSIRLANTRLRISVWVSGFFTLLRLLKVSFGSKAWNSSNHACVHYNCGIYDIIC